MPEPLANASATIFGACSAFLCLEMVGLGLATATLRQKRNVWLNAEDGKRFSGTVADLEDRDVARLLRVHRNQLENCVPFFILGLLWVLSGTWSRLAAALFLTFTLSRVLHPFFYLTRRGRLRTASFTLSFVVIVILAGGLLWRAIAGDGLAIEVRSMSALPVAGHVAGV